MSVEQPEFRRLSDQTMMTVDVVAGTIYGGIAGFALSELAIAPLAFHDEFKARQELNSEEHNLRQSIQKGKIALDKAKDADTTSVAVDYSKLEHKINSQEARVSAIQDTHVPFDTLKTQADLITSGIFAVAGIIASVATGIRRRRSQDATGRA